MTGFRWVAVAAAAILAGCGPGVGKPCSLSDEPEPNDNRDQATLLALGADRVACSASDTDEDWYQFTSTGAGYFKVAFTAVGDGTVKAAVFAASDNGQVIEVDGSGAGKSLTVYFSAKAGQTFRVRVRGDAELSEAPAFKYTVNAGFTAVGDAFEPNDSRDTAAALTLGTAVNASFLAGFAAGEPLPEAARDDWFKVTLAAGQKLNVALENVATNVEPAMTVYAPDLSEYATESRTTPGQSLLWTAPDAIATAGQYWLRVYPSGSVDEAGEALPDHFTRQYKLTVKQVP